MRRPAPLIAAPRARLAAYALLAGAGALQWARYVQGMSAIRPLLWVVAGTVTGALVLAAGRLPGRWPAAGAAGAALAGLLLAVAASGIGLAELLPRNWAGLGDGLAQGAQALNTVRLPYLGRDPWVLATVGLAGAGLCWGAAVAAAWPRPSGAGGTRLFALVLLLILAASPVVSVGAAHPVLLGLALAVLTAAFLWLERLPTRPGIGLAVLLVAALLVAIPLGRAVDREQPWFDYKAFSEQFAGGRPITFDWNHGYGPIDWPREGAEVLRVRSREPLYWKADQLSAFDGREWVVDRGSGGGGTRPVDDLPRNWREHDGWDAQFSVTLKRLRTPTVVGAGTIIGVTDATRAVEPDVMPGRWVVSGGHELSAGDTYDVLAQVPRPTPAQLAAAPVGRHTRQQADLTLHIPFRPDALAGSPRSPLVPGRPRRYLGEADVRFAPFGADRPPTAHYRMLGTTGSGPAALRRSFYARTWALARTLRRRATSPYDYVLRVNSYLRNPRFQYTEVPPRINTSRDAPLDAFLFDTHRGYCQQFSGAMALLLRMGGIPARVATGFTPGGFRSSTGEWVVRDTDAHSWVEAWFDGIGWVTLDPTPPQTPARSQLAAIDPASPSAPAAAEPGHTDARPPNRVPDAFQREPAAAPSTATQTGGAPVLPVAALGAALLAAAGAVFARRRRARRVPAAEAALIELERALRRSGRPAPAGTTLAQLERRLGGSGDGAAYLRALRAARYGAAPAAPTGAQRAAFRRELAGGLGWGGRLRALWALPPRVYDLRRRPR